MKGFLAAIGAVVACGVVLSKLLAGLPDAPPNNVAKLGDHFASVLRANHLTCNRIVSISPAGYTDCADGHEYKIWYESVTVREGVVERYRNALHVRVIK